MNLSGDTLTDSDVRRIVHALYTARDKADSIQLEIEEGEIDPDEAAERLNAMFECLKDEMNGATDPIDTRYFTDGCNVWKFETGKHPMTRDVDDDTWGKSAYHSLAEFQVALGKVREITAEEGAVMTQHTLTHEDINSIKAELVQFLITQHKDELDYISPAQAAGILDVNPKTLMGLKIPRYVLVPNKVIKYRISEVLAYLKTVRES